jgi:cytoskeletal protein CcmA (bactofilin family)
MFEKKSPGTNDKPDVFRPAKGSSKAIIGNGVKLKGEITDADEVQIDGSADVILSTDNLIVGSTGSLKGTIQTDNADVWGNVDGDLKISGTLTIQEQGSVSGSVEYQSLQIKLGGKIKGDVKDSDKIKKITDSPKSDNSSSLQDTIKEQKS